MQIIIPLGDGRHPLRVARCLGQANGRFVLLSSDRQNVARWSQHCSQFIHVPEHEDATLLDLLNSIDPGSNSCQIILPVTTEGFQFVSRHREALRKRFRISPISAVEELTVASDKWRLYQFAAANDVPMLKSTRLSEIGGETDVTFPALIKTRSREGGSGFRKVNSRSELSAVLADFNQKELDGAILQRFVSGVDVSLSAFCDHGKIVAHATWEAVAYGKKPYQIPVCIRFVEIPRILEISQRLLKLLNWQGVCDLDFFVDNHTGEIWLLEINARFWGNVVSCAAAGINFPALACEVAVNPAYSRWPRQNDGIFCFPKGLPKAFRNSTLLRQIVRRPFGNTGIDAVLKDLGPEFYKLYLKIERLTRIKQRR